MEPSSSSISKRIHLPQKASFWNLLSNTTSHHNKQDLTHSLPSTSTVFPFIIACQQSYITVDLVEVSWRCSSKIAGCESYPCVIILIPLHPWYYIVLQAVGKDYIASSTVLKQHYVSLCPFSLSFESPGHTIVTQFGESPHPCYITRTPLPSETLVHRCALLFETEIAAVIHLLPSWYSHFRIHSRCLRSMTSLLDLTLSVERSRKTRPCQEAVEGLVKDEVFDEVDDDVKEEGRRGYS